MVANTWEWVSDFWTTKHSGEKQTNPQGPTNLKSKTRTMKGGMSLLDSDNDNIIVLFDCDMMSIHL